MTDGGPCFNNSCSVNDVHNNVCTHPVEQCLVCGARIPERPKQQLSFNVPKKILDNYLSLEERINNGSEPVDLETIEIINPPPGGKRVLVRFTLGVIVEFD